jgi:hypothetical protein
MMMMMMMTMAMIMMMMMMNMTMTMTMMMMKMMRMIVQFDGFDKFPPMIDLNFVYGMMNQSHSLHYPIAMCFSWFNLQTQVVLV